MIVDSALRRIEDASLEVVERKGLGHPDTLTDRFAEAFVTEYVAWTREHLGGPPHHWVDKCVLIGGESFNTFGESHLITPIRALVIGKAAQHTAGTDIPLQDFARTATDRTLGAGLVGFTPQDCQVQILTNDYVGSGRPATWFRPTDVQSAQTVERSNDSVVCTTSAPHSRLERLVIELECYLTSQEYRRQRPATGTDVKVLATRTGQDVALVLCVPALPTQVHSRAEYDAFTAAVSADVTAYVKEHSELSLAGLRLNTRDDEKTVYMAHLGSALATGDVGAVGRGNRLNGVIAPGRTSHLEAPAGKNPHYHGGKVSLVLAQAIADQVSQLVQSEVQVTIVAENGQRLDEPTVIGIELAGTCTGPQKLTIRATVDHTLSRLEALTEHLATHGLDMYSGNTATMTAGLLADLP